MVNKETKKRRALITYGVFAVVLVSLILYIVLRRSDRMQYGLPDIEEVAVTDITVVTIGDETGPVVELRRTDDEWQIQPEGYRADPEAVDDMLEALSDLKVTDLVSTSKSYQRYELDDPQKLTLSAGNEDSTLRVFDLGKRAPSYNHTYIKLEKDPNIYHAAGDLRRVFDKEKESLRDKKVLTFQKDDVIKIGVTLPEREFQLFKSSPEVSTDTQGSTAAVVWKTTEDTEWSEEQVDELLDRLDDLSCTEFVADTAADLGAPQLILRISTQDQHDFSLYDKDDTGYRAKSSQTPYPFYISGWQGDQILETFTEGQTDDQ